MQLLTVQLPKGQQDFYKKIISIIPMVSRSSKYHLQLWALNVRSFEWCARVDVSHLLLNSSNRNRNREQHSRNKTWDLQAWFPGYTYSKLPRNLKYLRFSISIPETDLNANLQKKRNVLCTRDSHPSHALPFFSHLLFSSLTPTFFAQLGPKKVLFQGMWVNVSVVPSFFSHLGTNLRDWAVMAVRAVCFSWAALSINEWKIRYAFNAR